MCVKVNMPAMGRNIHPNIFNTTLDFIKLFSFVKVTHSKMYLIVRPHEATIDIKRGTSNQ